MDKALRNLLRARIDLVLSQPFFGYLAVFLEPKQAKGKWCNTAATDGKHLFYNSDFVCRLDRDDCLYVIAHEILHCALGHIWRRGDRDRGKWNAAIDYAVNGILAEEGFETSIDHLYNSHFNGMSAEQIYERLPKGINSTTLDVHVEQNDLSSLVDTELSSVDETEWQLRTKTSIEEFVKQGNVPNSLLRKFSEDFGPKIDWKTYLCFFFTRLSRDDYSWLPPNRKHLNTGFLLPAIRSRTLNIVVALDTSGSISDDDLSEFVAEVYSIVVMLPCRLTVIACDAEVHEIHTFEMHEKPDVPSVTGGGGTDFRPVFSKIDEEAIGPSCLIFFTDGCGTFPEYKPHYPVVWVVKNKNPHGIRPYDNLGGPNLYTPWGLEIEL